MTRKAPASPPSGPALDAADDALVEEFDIEMAASASRAGPLFRCYAGRRDCCRGLFPINLLDARRLQRGMRALEKEDPARAKAVRTRATRVVRRVARDCPGDPSTGLFDGDEPTEEILDDEATTNEILDDRILDKESLDDVNRLARMLSDDDDGEK